MAVSVFTIACFFLQTIADIKLDLKGQAKQKQQAKNRRRAGYEDLVKCLFSSIRCWSVLIKRFIGPLAKIGAWVWEVFANQYDKNLV